MVNRWQVTRGAQRLAVVSISAALFALPAVAGAQKGSGDGFMFNRPSGSLTIRGGYELANTSSEPFQIIKRETTAGARSFDAFAVGFDYNVVITQRTDFVLSLDLSSRTKSAEYREWEENGRPIINQTTLDRVALGAGFRYNLVDRGRQVSALAFIPAKTVPYVGATGGVLWYELQQKGDFVEVVDDSTGNIFNDKLESDHYNVMGQVFAGIDRRLNARWSLVGETRYTHAKAKLNKDYTGLGDIQLSGLAFTLGAAVRF